LIKTFKCRTFPEDTMTLDYGISHILFTTRWEDKLTGRNRVLSVCLNDKDIDQMIKYLMEVRGK
jgi:hypothetical protein